MKKRVIELAYTLITSGTLSRLTPEDYPESPALNVSIIELQTFIMFTRELCINENNTRDGA